MRLALNYQRIDPTKGGAETYVVDLCRYLIAAGHSVDLLAESWREGVLPPAVRCIPIEARGRTRVARMVAFGRNSEHALRQSSYDASTGFINTWYHDVLIPQGGVHEGSLEANSKRFPAGWRRSLYVLGKKANPTFWAYRAIERRQYDPSRSTRVVAVSRMVMEHLGRFQHVPKHRIHVIPNAIDSARLVASQPGATRCAFRNAHGLSPAELVGLFVGHNYRLKGLRPLLRALAFRKSNNPGVRPITLLVCGGGSSRPFERMAHGLGLADQVRFLGYVPDIRSCYFASDFFVSPTYYDPCSLVVLEALACGLPVITTACNGAGELMNDGEEGYVVTAPDALGELATALDRIADDRARSTMSVKAARLGQEQSFDRHVARLVKVFEDVAAFKSKRTPHLGRAGTVAASRKFIL
jgi:UDP-glucose:(heptosyl)LPS alpha-1,3-glucosyltransferase